jgi:hypothetical protein
VAVFGRGGAVLEHGNLPLGVSQVRSEGKMATDLEMVTLFLYHFPIFSLIMMRVGAEDQELGQSIGLFSCFLLTGAVVWGRILRLLRLGGGPHSSPPDGFGEVGVPGGTTG